MDPTQAECSRSCFQSSSAQVSTLLTLSTDLYNPFKPRCQCSDFYWYYFLFHLLPLSMMRKEGVILTAFDRLSGDDSTFPEYLSTLRFLQRGFLSSGSPALDARIIREQPRRGQRQIEEDGQVDVNQSNAHNILHFPSL